MSKHSRAIRNIQPLTIVERLSILGWKVYDSTMYTILAIATIGFYIATIGLCGYAWFKIITLIARS